MFDRRHTADVRNLDEEQRVLRCELDLANPALQIWSTDWLRHSIRQDEIILYTIKSHTPYSLNCEASQVTRVR
jgi:hypothetical protein